jgi:hypothetical protein
MGQETLSEAFLNYEAHHFRECFTRKSSLFVPSILILDFVISTHRPEQPKVSIAPSSSTPINARPASLTVLIYTKSRYVDITGTLLKLKHLLFLDNSAADIHFLPRQPVDG